MESCDNNPTVHATTRSVCQEENESDTVEAIARRLLAEHPLFCGHMKTIDLKYGRGTLTISGCVPSFYLKQVVQELFRHMDGVECVDNRVDVACPHGLSSVRRQSEARETTG